MKDEEKKFVLIVEAHFYDDIAEELAKGATRVLDQAGVDYVRHAVPGVFEIPAAVRYAIRSMEFHSALRRFSGFVTLGCVIRGETSHYDYICSESARALMDLTTGYCIALGNGVLTCETREQAWERAAVGKSDKGGTAARACLRMMKVKRDLRLVPR